MLLWLFQIKEKSQSFPKESIEHKILEAVYLILGAAVCLFCNAIKI